MNAPLRRLGIVATLLLMSILIATTWIQFVNAESISEGPGNSRQLYADYGRDRGDIVAGDVTVATSTPVDDSFSYQRSYPQGALYAHITGYYPIQGEVTGMEAAEDEILSGTAGELFYRRLQDMLTGRDPSGGIVKLTIDPAVQAAAAEALGDQPGAVVAMDPTTGRILALVSSPTYDPNSLSSHDTSAVADAYEALLADEDDPLANRALAGDTYPPGSVFKLVTAAAAIENGIANPDTVLPGPAQYALPGSSDTLPNFDGGNCGSGDVTTLTNALRISCNTAFAYLGNQLGDDALREQAEAFGFGLQLQIPLSVTTSRFPEDLDGAQTALSAIGQSSVRVTPLQVAMWTAAIANDGRMMQPELVDSILAPDLTEISSTSPEQLGQPISQSTADQITDMMEVVVESGSGEAAQIDDIAVAGKTGTAETGNDDPPHVWFTGFAPADDPQVVVTVLVENGGDAGDDASGGRTAAPIARAVMEAVLGLG